MLCQICKKREAELLLYRMMNGKKIEFHICKECAALFTHQISSLTLPQFNLNDLLIGLLSALDFYENEEAIFANKKLMCSQCHLTYEEFRQTGRLGCSQCYENFKEKLKPLLVKLQGNYSHTGKMPLRMKNILNKKKEIARLKNDLNVAISKEEYEKAARLRDEIKKMKGLIEQTNE